MGFGAPSRVLAAQFGDTLADTVSVRSDQILPAALVSVPVGTDFRSSTSQQGHGVVQRLTFDPGQIGHRRQRGAIDTGGAVQIDPMALAEQLVQNPNGFGQAATLIIGIEIAHRAAFHAQALGTTVARESWIIDFQFFQALVVLQRQHRRNPGFGLEAIEIDRAVWAATDRQVVPNRVPVQAPGPCG